MMVYAIVMGMNQLRYSTEKMVPSSHSIGIVMVYIIEREIDRLEYGTTKVVW